MSPPTATHLRTEPGHTLIDQQPRTMGTGDQIALWGNLGFSLLGPVGAWYVLNPSTGAPLSREGAFLAIVAGTVAGATLLAVANLAGARGGQPAMVLLRGALGARLSYLPTALNLVQLLGWAMFELLVITAALRQLLPWETRWPYVVVAGGLTTMMAIWPLGSIRLLRRYASVAVVIAVGYLVVRLADRPVPSSGDSNWSGFWAGADVVVALAVSWIPLAADYSRHSRSERGAFFGSLIGFAGGQIACYGLGLFAFGAVAATGGHPPPDTFGVFVAVPFGWLALAVLVARELDESFANVYSTVVSAQNLRPLADRRGLAVLVGTVVTTGALIVDVHNFRDFLYLVGSVFVPLFAIFGVRYFLLGGHRVWRTGTDAPEQPMTLLPWLLGFAAYQVVNPGSLGWWSHLWIDLRERLHLTPPAWLGASLTSLLVAGLATLMLVPMTRNRAPSSTANPERERRA